jgi:hypothetical protein
MWNFVGAVASLASLSLGDQANQENELMRDGNQDRSQRLALLIDAENIRVEFLPVILREASAVGTITVRRAYGHFAGTGMKGWHESVHEHALTPIHVPPRTKGKMLPI